MKECWSKNNERNKVSKGNNCYTVWKYLKVRANVLFGFDQLNFLESIKLSQLEDF